MSEYYKKLLLEEFSDYAELVDYIWKNHISSVDIDKIFGYMKVLGIIRYYGGSLSSPEKCNVYYIVAERFDGEKQLIDMANIQISIRSDERHKISNRRYRLVNVEFTYFGDIMKVAEIEYHPTYKSIYGYISNVLAKNNKIWSKVEYDNLDEQLTNMTEQQFMELKAKLNMLGATYDLVDYNTIAVLDKQKEKALIYTMQPKIIKNLSLF
jgi:hypothetical protein